MNRWNFYATLAAKDMSEDHVKEVKRQLITEPVKASMEAGNGSEIYREIVKLATNTLNRLVREWFHLRREDRPNAKDEMFGKMIEYCRDRVLNKEKSVFER